MICRHCASELTIPFIDLGFAPPSNAYLSTEDLEKPEKYFPLKVAVCSNCWLAQTADYAQAHELFNSGYAYFSSTSSSWLAHASHYAKKAIDSLSLNAKSFVIEVASNDGYLLKNFVAAGIPCLGIEPTASTAEFAERLGIPVIREFFGESLGRKLAAEGRCADLIIGNNVYAHVPDINDFTLGMKKVLKVGGVVSLEFPHILKLIEKTQFDTIYHEHFSYLSLYSVSRIFQSAGLRIYDVEELATHGGSLRVFGCHIEDSRPTSPSVGQVLMSEDAAGLRKEKTYLEFQGRADKIKDDLLRFLIDAKLSKKVVAGYGAAAKGNTLLNYAGVKPDLLPFICDSAPAKQAKFTPGGHIPILSPAALLDVEPDFILILPWNIQDEILEQQKLVVKRGAQFLVAIPHLHFVFPVS